MEHKINASLQLSLNPASLLHFGHMACGISPLLENSGSFSLDAKCVCVCELPSLKSIHRLSTQFKLSSCQVFLSGLKKSIVDLAPCCGSLWHLWHFNVFANICIGQIPVLSVGGRNHVFLEKHIQVEFEYCICRQVWQRKNHEEI